MTPDPNCPADRHHTLRAHREHHCVCPGASWDRWMTYRARKNARERPKDRARWHDRKSGPGAPRVIPSAGSWRSTELDAALRERTDLACRTHDPELFCLDLDERSITAIVQVNRAKQVCDGCPARTLCLEASLAHEDPWSILGGLTPRERDALRRSERAA